MKYIYPAKLAFTALMASVLLVAAAQAQRSNDRVLFEDAHIRFVEVTYWPGEKAMVVDERYPAVLAADAAWPAMTDRPLAKDAVQGIGVSSAVKPPSNKPYPWCRTQTAQSPHEVTIDGSFPMHFYRIDYKRIDGEGYSVNWKTWYPWILAPVKQVKDLGRTPVPGKPFSKEWPYPIAYDAVAAAPANHFVRYEDDHVQLLEVVIREDEKENMHGHPYHSVFAADVTPPYAPFMFAREMLGPYIDQLVASGAKNEVLNPGMPDAHGPGSSPPPGMMLPICQVAVPEAPHQASKSGKAIAPDHFYRLQFKRVDAEDIKTRWKQWYPDS